MEKKDKKWVKVPWTTIAMQAGLLVIFSFLTMF